MIQIRGLLRPDAERAAYDNDDDRARFIPTAIRLGDESKKRLREGRWGSAWEERRNAEAQNASAMTFYEFFCGGGMARADLGPGWACLVANDNDRRKGAAYAANWTANQLIIDDVASLAAADLPRRRRSRLGVASLPGRFPGRRSRWPRRQALRRVLAVLETHAGPSPGAAVDRDRKRLRLADVAWREGP
jgi:hypothetical protein